jgi:hypothetical protein
VSKFIANPTIEEDFSDKFLTWGWSQKKNDFPFFMFIKNKIFIDREYYSHSKEDIFILNKFRKKKGFYIDVGCHHPTRLNNCHLLYKNGWRGINIDLKKTYRRPL